MSIGRRILDVARSELNSLLDLAAKHAGDDENDRDSAGPSSLYGYSARELEEELERRRSARQEVEDAIHGRRASEPPSEAGARAKTDAQGRRGADPSPPAEALRVQQAYAMLEVAPGAGFEVVRKSYRALMRRYHPDHHTETPEKQRAANEVAQRLTEAYRLLEKTLRP